MLCRYLNVYVEYKMALLDLRRGDLDFVPRPFLLQPGGTQIPPQLHILTDLHDGLQLHPWGDLHFLESLECPDRSCHDFDGLHRPHDLLLLCNSPPPLTFYRPATS